MIHNLFERGSMIQFKDKKAIDKLESKIHNSLENQYNTRIVGAFLIFETQCSLKEAVKIFQTEKHPFNIVRA